MPGQNIISLIIGRVAGKSAGVPPENLGRLASTKVKIEKAQKADKPAKSK